MNKKGLALASLALMLTLGFGVTTQAKPTSSISLASLKQQSSEKNVNVLLYNEKGQIEQEFHTDGLEVTYKYDALGKLNESVDNRGGKQKYIDKANYIEVVDYQGDKEIGRHTLSEKNHLVKERSKEQQIKDEQDKLKKSFVSNPTTVTPMSTTVYEDYYVNGVLMNDLVPGGCPCNGSSDPFINLDSMTQSEIQSFFENKNSILKSSVQIWKKNSSGTVYDTGTSILPSQAIYNAAQASRMNPKVVIASLQKESSLVGATPGSVSYSNRRFYYALGYGATDGGDLSGTSGFDVQIEKGTQLFKDLWFQSPSGPYPVLFSGINYNQTKTSNGVTYKNYIWVKNYGTWALYKYTPHALDTALLPNIGGGNYLFYTIFKGYWGTDWN